MKLGPKPRRLAQGAVVSLVAPSGPVKKEAFCAGARLIEAAGFRLKFAPELFADDGYLAGTDERRLGEMAAAFSDPLTAAVWCARGGYGSMRLLGRLDFAGIARTRKPLIGFSDATALELALLAKAGFVTFHGPLVSTLGAEIEISRRHLFELLSGAVSRVEIGGPGAETIRPGACEGRLVGGNLSVISCLLGTGFVPDLSGAILFLEDINEEPYRIDRMLTQLELSGTFDAIAGLVVGTLGTDADADALRAIVREKARGRRWPAVFGFPIGHGPLNMALPQGIMARVDADRRSIELLEPCVE
ncbi:MAG: LD-carboxypeptidase [Deltaproteobacteria bacterium]|nr:LD-carboxypeptidase [Deltaproteobacteria bacterium]